MASAGLREELECSICLNLYTDPVILRCGHNFCRVCIDQVLNTQEASGVYSCPECRGKFQERPALQKNITLCNVVENFLSTHQDEAVIFCTYCVDSPVPAVKSCLMCEASLCDKHLKVHIKGGEHVLTEPRTSLENRKCPIHKKILEYYCTEDAACICVSCCLIGEHSGHKMESLDEASKNKKKKLRNVLQKLITKRKKREERVRSLEERRRKAQEKASGEAKRVTALFIDMRRQMDNLEKRILSEISKQEEKMSRSLSDVIHQLEIKKDELSRKMRHIEELCNMADPLTVLQGPDPGDLCDPEEEGGDENTGRHDGGDRGLELLLHTLSDMIRDVNVTFYLQDPVDILLDVNTANNNIRISDDLKTASRTDINKNCLKIIKACHIIPKSKPSPLTFGSHSFFQMNKGFGFNNFPEGNKGFGFKNFPEENKGFVFKNCPEENKGCGFKICPKDNKGFGFQNFPEGNKGFGFNNFPEGNKGFGFQNFPEENKGFGFQNFPEENKGFGFQNFPEENKGFGFKNFPEVNKGFGFQNVPQVADSSRFKTHPQVMSNKNFSSGRHYWDVEISGAGRWRVGMCYPSIDRSGDQSYIGNNNKSWALCRETLNNNQYLVIHDSKWIQLPHQISSNRVRICLDYEAGQLSFYELCDPIRRLHTFTTTFTEPLHAALCVNKGLQK